MSIIIPFITLTCGGSSRTSPSRARGAAFLQVAPCWVLVSPSVLALERALAPLGLLIGALASLPQTVLCFRGREELTA